MVMKLYSYVIPRDFGFAPNPYFDYCTLATCKPRIRKCAQIGDWIAAFGSASTPIREKMIMLMQVEETLSFDEYWQDERFICKRPVSNKGIKHMYGDNIYHHVGTDWVQEWSHHSLEDGSTNYSNLNRDTQTDRVLIAREFYYFGRDAIAIPYEFDLLIGRGRNHIVCKDNDLINNFICYIRTNYVVGRQGLPYNRIPGEFIYYRGE